MKYKYWNKKNILYFTLIEIKTIFGKYLPLEHLTMKRFNSITGPPILASRESPCNKTGWNSLFSKLQNIPWETIIITSYLIALYWKRKSWITRYTFVGYFKFTVCFIHKCSIKHWLKYCIKLFGKYCCYSFLFYLQFKSITGSSPCLENYIKYIPTLVSES